VGAEQRGGFLRAQSSPQLTSATIPRRSRFPDAGARRWRKGLPPTLCDGAVEAVANKGETSFNAPTSIEPTLVPVLLSVIWRHGRSDLSSSRPMRPGSRRSPRSRELRLSVRHGGSRPRTAR
jgi:hypothetical protein